MHLLLWNVTIDVSYVVWTWFCQIKLKTNNNKKNFSGIIHDGVTLLFLRLKWGLVLRRMRSVAFIVYFETGGPFTLLKPNSLFHCELSFAPLSHFCLFSLSSNLSDVRAEDQVPQHQSQRSEREEYFLQRWSDNRTCLLRALKGDHRNFDNDGSERKSARPLVLWFRRETTKPETLHGKSGLL